MEIDRSQGRKLSDSPNITSPHRDRNTDTDSDSDSDWDWDSIKADFMLSLKDVRVAPPPLVKFFNVSLSGSSLTNDCQLYGDIAVRDMCGLVFLMYHRLESNPQSIVSGENLLTDEKDLGDVVTIPSNDLLLHFSLVASSKLRLCDNITLAIPCGKDGWDEEYAGVSYLRVPYAGTATNSKKKNQSRLENEMYPSRVPILQSRHTDWDYDLDNDDVKPCCYQGLHVAPLVEIFNVSLHGSCLTKDCRVYGYIEVSDKHGRVFHIYRRPESDPQSIVSGDNLLLTVEKDLENTVIIPSDNVHLHVNLAASSKLRLLDNITLDISRGKDRWDEEYCSKLSGREDFYVKVNYATFPYAVTATVSILFFSNDDAHLFQNEREEEEEDVTNYNKHNCSHFANLYGSVTSSVSSNKSQMTSLFSNPRENCVKVQCGSFINLSRSVVVVPAYSSLQIEASLYDGDTAGLIAEGKVQFRPEDCKKDIVGINEGILVQVVWSSGVYRELYRTNSESDEVESRQSTSSYFIPHEDYITNRRIPSPCSMDILLEVFSVVVCSRGLKPFKFYGSVYVTIGLSSECILRIDKSCPVECHKSGMPIIVHGPRQDHFSMSHLPLVIDVDFRDAISEAVISCGHVDPLDLESNLVAERRICSVVRGEQGFAAVHYSIFPKAVCAEVKIKLSAKCLPRVINGEIYALYGSFEPGRCSCVDKLFTNFLFYDKDDGLRVDGVDSTLTLLKPLISIPIDSFLIIKADLTVSLVRDNLSQGRKPIKGEAKFLKNEDFPRQIGEGDCYLDVTVLYRYT
ncbi:uncharacterized protein LOC141657562 isoform X2 [Silene latifolia]|uniref:uncharacterized protein LOC141657562 isoform X2 n=1 Tax=Silene latifolia TaxID=37657 RepID=UPI003D77284D